MRKFFLLLIITASFIAHLSGQNADKKRFADSLNRKSVENLANDNFIRAIINSNQSLKVYQEINDKEGIANSLYQLAECNAFLSDYKKAYSYAQQSLRNYHELNDKRGAADCYEVIGNYYEYLEKDIYKALDAYKRGLKFSEKANYKKRKAYLLGNIARIHFKLNRLEEALAYNFESSKIKEELNDKKGVGFSLHKIGQIYLKQGNIKKANEYAQKSMVLAQTNNYLENIKRSADLLKEIYLKQGRYKQALDMSELSTKSRDSITNISLQKVALQKELQYLFDKKQAADSLKVAEERKMNTLQFEQEKKQRWFLYGGLALTAIFAGFMFSRYRIIQKQNIIIEQKEVETQKQKHFIEEKQKEILDSITYAKRLQQAILPQTDFINEKLSNNFVLYKPKDIVAGDFYWAEEVGNLFFIAAADCTGHGVPGAMVSVVCSNALNRTLKELGLTDTGKILDKTRELVIETFEKSNTEVKDGMDISLLCIDKQNQKVVWSGANNPLWYVQDDNLIEIKANKQSIGKTDNPIPFTTQQIDFKTGSTFYLFTDGVADQFGGPKGKKFKYKQFGELLVSISEKPMQEQSEIINKTFEDWKGMLEQVDDICVIGIRI